MSPLRIELDDATRIGSPRAVSGLTQESVSFERSIDTARPRVDVAGNPSRGGDREPSTPPIAGSVISTQENQAVIQLPEKEGNYRLFVYAFDPKGSAATANLPVQITGTK